MPHYVLDDNNNKIEAYSKEEILSVIAQAVHDGTLANIVADAGFISKIKCCVGGQTYKEAFVTQAKYNELKANNQLIENCLYNIIDDTTADDINEVLEDQGAKVENIINGTTTVPNAAQANNANNVSSTIRGVDVYDIFESDDADNITSVVKQASNATSLKMTTLATPNHTFKSGSVTKNYILGTNVFANVGAILFLEIAVSYDSETPYYIRKPIYIYGEDERELCLEFKTRLGNIMTCIKYKYYGGKLKLELFQSPSTDNYTITRIDYIELGV